MIKVDYFNENDIVMARIRSDCHKYVIDKDGSQYEEYIEPADPENRFEEGDYLPDAPDEDKAVDILDILLGEEDYDDNETES